MTAQLFTPLNLGSLELKNRIVVAPMCQYSAVDGTMSDWHLMHLGQFAVGGYGLVMVEATGVEAAGRITPGCTGLWSDENEAAMARVVRFFRDYGNSPIGIQLAHAGRKASCDVPWAGGAPLTDERKWQTSAPSALPYDDNWHVPEAMDGAALVRVRDAFVQAAERAVRAGFDVIELHGAHGYLLHEFMSPLSNQRNDEYGGSLENRQRYPLEIFDAVRAVVPDRIPVGMRVSATDWVEGGWSLDETVSLAGELKGRGCAFLDVSSAGNSPQQKIVNGPGYQVPFASEIKRNTGITTMAVGRITDPLQAETIVASGQADCVALARGALYDPRWPWHAADALGAQAAFPPQYMRTHPTLKSTPIPANPPNTKDV